VRYMYDGVSPGRLPADAAMVGGYVNGMYAWSAASWARFPKARKVTIAVTAAASANVLDVETGDATPTQAPGWALNERREGHIPTVYCNRSTWPAVRAAFVNQHVTQPQYWIASYSSSTVIPAGAVALQYENTPGYDLSIVEDHWPGVDPEPVPTPTPTPVEDSIMKCGIQQYPAKTGGQWLITVNATGVLVRSPLKTTAAVLAVETMGAVATAFDQTTLAAMPVVA
jgi:hypothetical protein